MDGRRRAGVGGQNCDGALLTARPLSGHAHPVRRQQAPPQAMVDRSEPRHVSQLHCGSDHDLGQHAGDHHGQTTAWGRYTPILTVALRRRAPRPRRAAKRETRPLRHLREPTQSGHLKACQPAAGRATGGDWVGRSLNATVPITPTVQRPSHTSHRRTTDSRPRADRVVPRRSAAG